MKNLFSTIVLLILFLGVKGQAKQMTANEAKNLLQGNCFNFDIGNRSGSFSSLILRKIQFCSTGSLICNRINYYSSGSGYETQSTDFGSWNVILHQNELYLEMAWKGSRPEYIRLIPNPYNKSFNFDWEGSISHCGYTRCY